MKHVKKLRHHGNAPNGPSQSRRLPHLTWPMLHIARYFVTCGLIAIVWGGVDMFILAGGGKLTMMAAISYSIGTVNLIFAAAAKFRDMML